jgi:predicted metalloprotease
MRWQQSRRSGNVVDARGRGGFGRIAGGGGFAGRGMRLGCGPLLLIGVVALLFGVNPLEILQLLGGGGGQPVPAEPTGAHPAGEDPAADFAAAILGSTEDAWGEVFARSGQQYPPPALVLYSGVVQSACGMGSSASGPFYCPGDQRLYLDLSFFNELHRMGAPGDFAAAYVIAHEVGHHVQNVEGTLAETQRLQQRLPQAQANRVSVATELQADCYAGVWGHSAAQSNLLEPGDVDEGLQAAAAVGDDALQRASQGVVVPESFTHGSSAERAQWFRRGLESGDTSTCDTFDGM